MKEDCFPESVPLMQCQLNSRKSLIICQEYCLLLQLVAITCSGKSAFMCDIYKDQQNRSGLIRKHWYIEKNCIVTVYVLTKRLGSFRLYRGRCAIAPPNIFLPVSGN